MLSEPYFEAFLYKTGFGNIIHKKIKFMGRAHSGGGGGGHSAHIFVCTFYVPRQSEKLGAPEQLESENEGSGEGSSAEMGSMELTCIRIWLALWPAVTPGRCPNALAAVNRPWAATERLEGK